MNMWKRLSIYIPDDVEQIMMNKFGRVLSWSEIVDSFRWKTVAWWMSEKQIAWAESYAQKLFYSLSEDGDWTHWVWCTRRLRNVWDDKVPQSFMPYVATRITEMIWDRRDIEKFDFK